jgi:enterochelin esterase-like enzyme
VLEPDSNLILGLLVVVFVALIWWVRAAKRVTVQVVAATLAFLPAMLFGFAVVNKYYGYYQTWSAIQADFASGGTNNLPAIPNLGPHSSARLDTVLGRKVNRRMARAQGVTVRLQVPGRRSGITRQVLIFLPPQYFRPAYARYRFPVIELIHGWPGQPQDWVNVVHVTADLDSLTAAHAATPTVLVMPDVNGPRQWSEQCVNQVGGPRDAAYVAQDVPTYISTRIRVEPPGRAWGIAGYSEGGFCAANLALRYPSDYGYSASMSGYFTPEDNVNGGKIVPPFRNVVTLWERNDPMWLVRNWRGNDPLPRFWLSAARDDAEDYSALVSFDRLVRRRQPGVVTFIVPTGGHTAVVWRTATPHMLEWMTPLLARAADQPLPGAPARTTARITRSPRRGGR